MNYIWELGSIVNTEIEQKLVFDYFFRGREEIFYF